MGSREQGPINNETKEYRIFSIKRLVVYPALIRTQRLFEDRRLFIKEARNSFFGLGVYLLKSKFRIEDKLRFP